jgi:WD40 repeat protein
MQRTTDVTFSPDGRLLGSTSHDYARSAVLWDLGARRVDRALVGHEFAVHALAFSPDGQVVATASDDRTCRFWRVADGAQVHVVAHTAHTAFSAVAFSPDGKLVACGGDAATLLCLTFPDLTTVYRCDDQLEWIWAVGFSPAGDLLASSGDTEIITVWDSRKGRQVRQLSRDAPDEDHGAVDTRGIAFHPQLRVLASASDALVSGRPGSDEGISLWDIDSGTELAHVHYAGGVTSVAFSSSGDLLASGGLDGAITLWAVRVGD